MIHDDADDAHERHPADTATYRAVDLSATMTAIARERLQPFGEQAVVQTTDGRLPVDRPDASVDRVVLTYVLDLLSDAGIQTVLDAPRGRCSITRS